MGTDPGVVRVSQETDKINSSIARFYEAAKDRYPIKKIFVYGSYAHGNPAPDSDIDIGVVIDATDHSRRIEITAALFHLARKINNAIEPKCIFKDEYEQPKQASILAEIIRTGIDVSHLR
jgi:predicted nucleotidyltransferase